jgi:hypothetical protein
MTNRENFISVISQNFYQLEIFSSEDKSKSKLMKVNEAEGIPEKLQEIFLFDRREDKL